MSSRQYQFTHNADPKKVTDRLYTDLQNQARENGMTLTRIADREFSMKRTGADLTFTVTETHVSITADLSFFVEPFRGKIEAGLNAGMPKMLRECERG